VTLDAIEAEFQRDQYLTIRQELLDSNKNAHEAVRWGHGALAVMISAGLAAQTLQGVDVARVVYFGVVVPVFALVTFFLWFGEVVRQQRAYTFLDELEGKLNPLINSARNTLFWHHEWLKAQTKNPLQGLQVGHYRNMALGFFFWVPVAGALSVWACFIATESIAVRTAWLLFIAMQIAGIVVLYDGLAKRMFDYDLLTWLFAVPWLSYLSLACRIGIFVILGAHIMGAVRLPAVMTVLLCAGYVAIDLADGYLVRRFCPNHASAFEFLDRAVDMTGVTVLMLMLGLAGRLSPLIVWTVAIREGGLALVALVLSLFKRRPFSVSGPIGRLFHLYLAVLIVWAILGVNAPGRAAAAICIAIAAVSVVMYIRHPRLREAVRPTT
jgi:phosphatidylglycerophosphate synthase